MTYGRERKSLFVREFKNKYGMIVCPGFYELILSNGCRFDCDYCYLKGTFRGNAYYVDFTNPWDQIANELAKSGEGVYNTGELSDSLADLPTNFTQAMDYFHRQTDKFLLLVTKSNGQKLLDIMDILPAPNQQIIISFSVNSTKAWVEYEHGTPSPANRLSGAMELREMGYRIRIRIDPIINEFYDYGEIADWVSWLRPELVTLGTLRHYPHGKEYGIRDFEGLTPGLDGRLRYPLEKRVKIYKAFRDWIDDDIPVSLCKETVICWRELGWQNKGCNCTV